MISSPVLDTLVIVLLLFYGLILISLVGLYVWNRISEPVRETYTQRLCDCLRPQDTLPSMVFPDIEYSFNRRILVNLLSTLSPMLEGVESRILRLIFYDNGLEHHILRECRFQDDLRKIRSLSIFIDFPIPERLMTALSGLLNSRNNELRMVVLLAWLNQEPARIIDRLVEYPHELSDRECANIYALVQRRRDIPTQEAEKLFRSANPSVIRFGYRVLKLHGY